MQDFSVTQEEQIQDVLDWALSGKKKLAVVGNNSKVAMGRPMSCDGQLVLSNLRGIQMHEPAELVMQAKAGTLLKDVKAALADAEQELSFAPPDYGPLLGQGADLSSIGGAFSCNLSGSKRIKSGAARDHLLGVKGYSGRGQPFQAGGRVMKNVTGYDLCKLIAGSYGTLVACTSFTFKVLPRPEKTRTVLVFGLNDGQAVQTMRDAMSSIHEVSSAAFLPLDIAKTCGVDYVEKADASVVALRIEGPASSAEYRCKALRQELEPLGKIEELHGHNSSNFWNDVSDVKAFVADQSTIVWKVSLPPAVTPAYLDRLKEDMPHLQYFLDWAGGLVWLSVPDNLEKGGEQVIRRNLNGEGHATLIRGSRDLRTLISPFQPQKAVLANITERVRDGFDPSRIFNPGRMYPVEI